MNSNPNTIFQLRSILQSAQSVFIALAENADEDTVAAGLALYLVLTKMRKQVVIASPSPVKVDKAHFFAIDKITNHLSGDNTLIVSFPYQEGSIEKVSYNIEGETFNLVIEPRNEKLNFSQNDIKFNFGRGDYDLVFVLGAVQLTDLGSLYEKHSNVFSRKPIINIDKASNNSKYGKINLIEDSPISQTVALTLKALRMPIDQDPASNLYTGIIAGSGQLSLDSASPDLLETIAYLMRSKAQKLTASGSTTVPKQSADQQTHNVQQTTQNKTTATSQMDEKKYNQTTDGNSQNQNRQSNGFRADEQAPEDWLKPKIFTTDKPGGN